MPTQTTIIVDPDNGAGTDYTSLNAAIAGEQQNLVTNDVELTFECRNSSGSADTTAVVATGYMTDATRKVIIKSAAGYKVTSGPFDSSKYHLLPGATDTAINIIGIADIDIQDIQIKHQPGGSGVRNCIIVGNTTAGTVKILRNLMFPAAGSTLRCNGINIADGPSGSKVVAENNIIYDCNGNNSSHGIVCTEVLQTLYAYNNTIVNCYFGIRQVSGTVIAKNNLCDCDSFNAAFYDFLGTFDSASTDNASSDTTAPGSNPETSQTFTYVDAANDDFHLDASDAGAQSLGADLSSDANWPFSDDFDGDIRSAPWDIGADQIAATGININANTAALTIAGQQAAVSLDTVINAGTAVLAISGQPASVSVDAAIDANTAALTLTGQQAAIQSDIDIAAKVAAISIAGKSATIRIGFQPQDLFLSGENGDFVDPNDLTSMTVGTDGSGGQPGIGDPVGRITGQVNGLVWVAHSDAARPTLQLKQGNFVLDADGVDDIMLCPTTTGFTNKTELGIVGMMATDQPATFSPIRSALSIRNGDDFGNGATNLRPFMPQGMRVWYNNSTLSQIDAPPPPATDGTIQNFTYTQRAVNDHEGYIDGVSKLTSTASKTTNSVLSHLTIGGWSPTQSQFFEGQIASVVFINRGLTAQEVADLQTWAAERFAAGDTNIAAATAALTVAGQQALVSVDINITAAIAALAITGQPAIISVDSEIAANTAALTLSGQQAQVSLDVDIVAATAPLTLTGHQASVSVDTDIAAATANLMITPQPATVQLGNDIDIAANTAALTISGQQAQVSLDVDIAAATAPLTLTGQPATVQVVNDVNIDAATAGLTLTGNQATVSLDIDIQAVPAELNITPQPAIVSIDTDIAATTASLTITGNPASIQLSHDINANTAALSIIGQPASIQLDGAIDAGTAALTIAGQQATVSVQPSAPFDDPHLFDSTVPRVLVDSTAERVLAPRYN